MSYHAQVVKSCVLNTMYAVYDKQGNIQSVSKWKQWNSFKIAIGSVHHSVVCYFWNLYESSNVTLCTHKR